MEILRNTEVDCNFSELLVRSVKICLKYDVEPIRTSGLLHFQHVDKEACGEVVIAMTVDQDCPRIAVASPSASGIGCGGGGQLSRELWASSFSFTIKTE